MKKILLSLYLVGIAFFTTTTTNLFAEDFPLNSKTLACPKGYRLYTNLGDSLGKKYFSFNGSNPITDVKVIIANKGIRNTPTPYFIYYCWKTNGTETIVRIIEGKKLKELK